MKKILSAGFLCLCSFLLAQEPLTSIRFELFGDHIFFQMSVDGSDPLDFIFDTGDGLTVIDTEIALSLNLSLNHSKKKNKCAWYCHRVTHQAQLHKIVEVGI